MSKKTSEKAIIVGASLAGLMTGIALANTGFQVILLERASATPRSGASLQVDTGEHDQTENARVLRQLASGGKQSIETWTSIQYRLRAEAEAHPAIELKFDTRIQSVNQDADSAWAVTEGGDVYRGAFLIGADGHRSTVRRHVNPGKPDASFAGYLIWLGIIPEKDIPGKYWPRTTRSQFNIEDAEAGILISTVMSGEDGSFELGEKQLGFAWYDNSKNALLRELGCVRGNVVHHSLNGPDIPENTLQELSDRAKRNWSQPGLTVILECLKHRALIGTPIAEYVPPGLVNGRIAIVGDAAHAVTPMTAVGFNNSLQDAAVLADCLARRASENAVAEALLQYEALRLERVQAAVQAGQSFSRSYARK